MARVAWRLVRTLGLLPASHANYRYAGSLTTAPCSESVRWIVMQTPTTRASAEQFEALSALFGANNRPDSPCMTVRATGELDVLLGARSSC